MTPSRTTRKDDKPDNRTHFGYDQVATKEKSSRVRGVFDSVVDRYDLMNDLMSGGLHRLWKRFAIERARLRPGDFALDVAGGTGDLTRLMAPIVGNQGHVVLSDINSAMLAKARPRLIDHGIAGNVSFAQADAEHLPFADGSVDCVAIAFGLRNVTDKTAALQSMYRVLKPAGRAVILEFSHPVSTSLSRLYDLYSFSVLPLLGEIVAKDAASYRYLVESIRVHPDQKALLAMMQQAGFERCSYHNLAGGIVALHIGYRL